MATATTNGWFNLPAVGGDSGTWGDTLNANWTALDTLLGTNASGLVAADFVKLAGVTSSAAELNILDGVTATAAEINRVDGLTKDLSFLNAVTANSTEINKLDGLTATTAELNFIDGVTSAIQTQINAKVALGDIPTQTDATWQAGTDTTESLVSAEKIASNSYTYKATANDGGINLISGLQVRWGRQTSTLDTAQSFAYSQAFTTNTLVVMTQIRTVGSDKCLSVTLQDANGFTINRDDDIDGNQNFFYLAIGK